ncbi:16S rRNA (guanine(527)-N(7))-methyltransferase RsmG [Bdellovibrio bacteriovorus]|uniref:Ribosomal RNA small subunit methyltransferase G 1 n=1 Tax=Bdellovibrio bacteriovorus (strain ATCC 15356 / DSM 50701 / NCIMB 9529 / HD100) TaxID=264462 RepID=RSMG1_BDEBA|nr:16S rRNA (guanine(527)-N(7))-methyltransferase RsmG [Bdellovibrio bacteriovorus]Q6MQY9.1 RecName: Full=Ribosomal RNA small subunit methyltransferase G 1; AltName: Full=16S rRNA 7-methylguanosine methyltransferase 1; Short=16S rRNA m7G methyltransferase 1 [Bdellovibrio bacteriovorus HD100]CAE77969.1 glucose inhibited division protein B [Bdellovibrio bacteriovorus HD100]
MSEHFEKRRPVFLQLGFNEAALPQLKAYLDLLWSSNEELNLISRKMTYEELIDNHVIDCLLPIKDFPKDVKVAADFGSGGGLPGVIYAIQFPNVEYHLFEKSKLKQDFLNRCVSIAPNLRIHGEIPPKLEKIEVVTSRAFKPVDVILEFSRDYYKKGGKYFLLKGRKEKIDEEVALARKKFKDLKVTVQPLSSPVLEVERHLVLI